MRIFVKLKLPGAVKPQQKNVTFCLSFLAIDEVMFTCYFCATYFQNIESQTLNIVEKKSAHITTLSASTGLQSARSL
jgi:hypothetical protein